MSPHPLRTSKPADRWFPYRKPQPEARMRLFCFPFAGGSAAVFRTWSQGLPPAVEVCAVQPPGRERRMSEAPFRRLDALVEAVAEAMEPLLDRPFAFFGHSMGAKVAFELAQRQRHRGRPQPSRLFVSGSRAPHMPDDEPPLHALPDDELIQELHELGGTPREVLDNDELMRLLLPLLRADFEVNETYDPASHEPLDCPLSAFGGLRDPEVPPETVEGWREHTRGAFRRRMFEGHHFFLLEQQQELVAEVLSDLDGDL